MVTRCAGPGTTTTLPPPRSSTERKAGTGTTSAASAGAETAKASAKSGMIERIVAILCRLSYATSVALQLQRVQPGCTICFIAAFPGHVPATENHRKLRQPLRPQGARLPAPQGSLLRGRPDHRFLRR